jgi:hypothetical protein
LASNIETKVDNLLRKIIEDLGYELYDVVYEKNRLLIEDSVTSMGSKTVGKHSFYFRKHRIEYNYQYSSEDADNLP